MGNATGLTFGILKILNKQLGLPRQQPISVKDLKEKWQDIGLTEEGLDKICVVGNFNLSESSATINMEHFVAVAANSRLLHNVEMWLDHSRSSLKPFFGA